MCNKGLEVGRGCVTNLLCSPDGIMRPRRALKCIRRGLCGASATLQPTVNVVGRALVLGRGKDPRGVWTELRFILLGLPTCPPPPHCPGSSRPQALSRVVVCLVHLFAATMETWGGMSHTVTQGERGRRPAGGGMGVIYR